MSGLRALALPSGQVPAQPSTAHRIVHVVRKPRAGPAKVPFYQLCALNATKVNVTKDAVAKTQARQGPGATAQQRKRRPAEALEEAEAEAEPERPAWAVKRARTARAEWDDLLAEAHLAKAAVERAASAKAAKAQAEDAYTDSFADGYAHAAKPRRKTPRGSPPPRPRKARTAAARPQAARPPLPPLPPPPLPPPPPSTPAKAELAVAACYAAWRANEPVMPCSRVEAALAASAGPGEMAADDTALLEDLPPVGLAGALSGIDWAGPPASAARGREPDLPCLLQGW